MALPGDELDRRVKAAAALYGLNMRQVRDMLEMFGAQRMLAVSMISGRKQQNRRNIRDLAEAFAMPQEWFTAEDWRSVSLAEPAVDSELANEARARAQAILAGESGPIDLEEAEEIAGGESS